MFKQKKCSKKWLCKSNYSESCELSSLSQDRQFLKNQRFQIQNHSKMTSFFLN